MTRYIAITAALLLSACSGVTYETDRYGRTSVVHHHDDPCKQVSIGYLTDEPNPDLSAQFPDRKALKGGRIRAQWMRQTQGPCGAVLNGGLIGAGLSVIEPTAEVTVPPIKLGPR